MGVWIDVLNGGSRGVGDNWTLISTVMHPVFYKLQGTCNEMKRTTRGHAWYVSLSLHVPYGLVFA